MFCLLAVIITLCNLHLLHALPAADSQSVQAGKLWNLACDAAFYGIRLDAVDGSLFVALANPDPNSAAVMKFNGSEVMVSHSKTFIFVY